MIRPRVITLTTDFGDSAYVGAMKGAVYSVNPGARLVDVTHAVPAHDIMQGALALYAVAPYYPDDTVHVCVVDPGVGTARRPVLVEAEGAAFIGPDNGVLLPAAERLGLKRVRAITNRKLWRREVSATFHGRDVFAPTAAHVDAGTRFDEVGSVVDDFEHLDFGRVRHAEDGGIEGSVLAVDAFGNVITNVPQDTFGTEPGGIVTVRVDDRQLTLPYARTYGDVPKGETLLLAGSTGFLELSMNQGNAARTFDLQAGDAVRLMPERA